MKMGKIIKQTKAKCDCLKGALRIIAHKLDWSRKTRNETQITSFRNEGVGITKNPNNNTIHLKDDYNTLYRSVEDTSCMNYLKKNGRFEYPYIYERKLFCI